LTDYLRPHALGATWFCTLALARRRSNRLLVEEVAALKSSLAVVRERHPFRIDAIVVLPEHLHAICTLPPDDRALGMRWGLVKAGFSRRVEGSEVHSASRKRRGERGIWQRRFWEHLIRDEADLASHMDYLHFNPVKHGWVARVKDWPHSSFHRLVAKGVYDLDWGAGYTAGSLEAGE